VILLPEPRPSIQQKGTVGKELAKGCSPGISEAPGGSAFASITIFTNITNWCYNECMKRATMTLPDDLAEAVETYQQAQEVPPTLTTVVQVALRQYLVERGFLRGRRALEITPARKGSGLGNVSQEHDHYLARKRK
jgi:hypothetical protein